LSPPKAAFFNERNGIIYVRATLQDLEIIEPAIEELNTNLIRETRNLHDGGPEAQPLYPRIFHVNAETFLQGLQNAGAKGVGPLFDDVVRADGFDFDASRIPGLPPSEADLLDGGIG